MQPNAMMVRVDATSVRSKRQRIGQRVANVRFQRDDDDQKSRDSSSSFELSDGYLAERNARVAKTQES